MKEKDGRKFKERNEGREKESEEYRERSKESGTDIEKQRIKRNVESRTKKGRSLS
jgi:hypothetical protein